jgi:hypothetical protein
MGVCDEPTTPTLASLYAAFAPQDARRLAQRLEIHSTPKHGSWWNLAAVELRGLTKQGLARRLAEIDT